VLTQKYHQVCIQVVPDQVSAIGDPP